MRLSSGRALVLGIGTALLLAGCGGAKGKDSNDRAAVMSLWTQATELSRMHDFPRYCGLLGTAMTSAVLTTAGYPSQSSGTLVSCPDALEKVSRLLPDAPLKTLVITGSRAVGTYTDKGQTVSVTFAKTPGQWTIASLPHFNSGSSSVPAKPPGQVRSAEGRRVEAVLNTYYAALEAEDAATLCRNVTPDVQQKVIAIGRIQDAKTCTDAFKVVFAQISFSYHSLPTVTRVTITRQRAKAMATVEGHTLRTPLRKIGGSWKVDVLGA